MAKIEIHPMKKIVEERYQLCIWMNLIANDKAIKNIEKEKRGEKTHVNLDIFTDPVHIKKMFGEYFKTPKYTDLAYFGGHTENVSCLAVLKNKLYSGSWDKTIKIWDMKTYKEEGSLIGHMIGHTDNVICLCVQADDNKLYSGSIDRTIRVWDTKTHEHIATLVRHTCRVSCLAVLKNKLFSGSYDESICVWNTTTYEQIAVLRGHTSMVNCLIIHENKLYSGSKNIHVWDTETYEDIATLFPPSHVDKYPITLIVNCFAIHDGKLYSGHNGGTIRIWNLKTYKQTHLFSLHSYSSAMCFAFHENRLYSGHHDGNIHIWDTKTPNHIAKVSGHTTLVSCIVIHENKLVSGGFHKTINVLKI